MSKEAEGQVGIVANAREAALHRPAQRQNLGWTQVGEIAPFDVAPDLLDRVELGRIGRQAFDLKPGPLPGQVRPHPAALVRGQPVPEQDDPPAAEVALECAQERDQALVGVGAGVGLEVNAAPVTIPPKRQRGGDRQTLPVAADMGQDRRTTGWCERPLSSSRTSQARRRRAFFLPAPTAYASTARSLPRRVPGPGARDAAPTSSTPGADTRRAPDGTAPRSAAL